MNKPIAIQEIENIGALTLKLKFRFFFFASLQTFKFLDFRSRLCPYELVQSIKKNENSLLIFPKHTQPWSQTTQVPHIQILNLFNSNQYTKHKLGLLDKCKDGPKLRIQVNIYYVREEIPCRNLDKCQKVIL